MGRVVTLEDAKQVRQQARQEGKRVVFTNGCFDIIHRGHIEYLSQAKTLGQLLIVGLNSDRSVRVLKGRGRPVTHEMDRACVLSSLACVDYVLIFDEATPAQLIQSLIPDVLAKGGDWPIEKIVGRDVVEAYGGQVIAIDSSVPEYSSSRLIERVVAGEGAGLEAELAEEGEDALGRVVKSLSQSARLAQQTAQILGTAIVQAAETVVAALQQGHKVLLCGNGGSAADAQHIAAELVGRFQVERQGLPALALTTDTSILTSVGNDYQFEQIFARQVKALAAPGDVLLAISTSGNSENIACAVAAATAIGVSTIGLLGKDGGKIAGMVSLPLVVPAAETARIQEVHITIGHIVCEFVDRALCSHV